MTAETETAVVSEPPPTAFAIPSRNRASELARSMASVTTAAARSAPIFICDQSPQPFSHPGVLVLHHPDLSGLPAARNALLKATDADVVVFLDDDTDVAPDLLREVGRLAATEPHIAAWGAVVEARGAWTRRLHRLLHLGCLRDSRRLTSRRIDAETRELFGCCFAVRRQAALAVGGFDARMPGYALGEDRDFCWRLQQAGYRLRFASGLRAHHRAVGGQRPPLLARLRYLRWFASRHGRRNPATVAHVAITMLAWIVAQMLGRLKPAVRAG